MSDSVRTYGGGVGMPRTRSRRKRRRAGIRGGIVLLAGISVAAAYFYGIARDTTPLSHLVPAQARFLVVVHDAADLRGTVPGSPVWAALPDDNALRAALKRIQNGMGFREWIVRNILGPISVFHGDDAAALTDAVFVTRMSAAGVLLERAYRWSPDVSLDPAGGLNLRFHAAENLFYAVRGRVLVVSASRAALIRTLALARGDRISEAAFDALARNGSAQTIAGTILPDASGEVGARFESLGFALRLDGGKAAVRIRATLRPEAAEDYAALLKNASPAPLLDPPPGPFRIAGDVGIPLREVWAALGGVTGHELFSPGQWDTWATAEDPATAGPVLTALLGGAGPGFAIAWSGFDVNEVFPVAKLSGYCRADRERVQPFWEAMPENRGADAGLHAPRAYYAREQARMYAPTISGPSFTVTAQWLQDALYVQTGTDPVPPPHAQSRPREGNLYIALDPAGCIEALRGAGACLAENGLLRDHTAESFESMIAGWLERVRGFSSVEVLFSHRGRGILEGVLVADLSGATGL